MCGICGFVSDEFNKDDKMKIVKKMADRIIHRGPDSDGYFCDDKVGLGFRRLSIIDLKGGDQPLYNEKKDKLVFLNGEIYNYKELRKELEEKGHKFRSKSDTEVIVHGYEEYGIKLFNMLRGMYAFVIYDINTQELIGVRDIFGIKPLYYYKDNKSFMYGSEIKSFLDNPLFDKKLDKEVLKMYLAYGTNHMEKCFFENTFKLKPGHYFIYKDNKLTIKEYYKLEYNKKDGLYEEYKELTKSVIKESVLAHQVADVEIGSYLSGGVDSSFVVSEAHPDKTFTVGFDKQGFSEVDYAKDLSKIFNVKNYNKLISGDEFFNILPTVQYHCDEPSANVSTVPLYFLSKLAHEKVKVVLSGEGADEMFGGYNEYNVEGTEYKYSRLPYFIRRLLFFITKPLPRFKGKGIIYKYGDKIENRYYNKTIMINPKDINKILTKDYQTNHTPFELCKPYFDEVKDSNDDVLKKMYIDINFWLPNDILLKADKMSMANSVELRVPFLDKKVWELSSSLPTKYMVKDHQTKYIFRDVAHEQIPEEWSKRRKLGFPVPFGKWLREDKYYNMVKDTFNSSYAKEFFNIKYLNKVLDKQHLGKVSQGKMIYAVYTFLIWYKRFFIDC